VIETFVHAVMRRLAPVATAAIVLASFAGTAGPVVVHGVTMHPLIDDYDFVGGSETPPTTDQCHSVGRRCFTPDAIHAAYDLFPLYAQGFTGKGRTIAIVDSFGSDTIRNDLRVFDNAFNLPHMCGETDANGVALACTSGQPVFNAFSVQGSPPVSAPALTSANATTRVGWALEVSLDVEWAHAIAPEANVDLVTTPVAETLGVQGFPDMVNAEEFVITNHLADVISQSFGAGEETFSSVQSLLNLRGAYTAAQKAGVTVLASSGDGGTLNDLKIPVANPGIIPFPSVIWPASDPLVTAVGGTSLCVDEATGTQFDTSVPPAWCQSDTAVREPAWTRFRTNPVTGALIEGGLSGGGFSHVFSRPAYQNGLPTGSTPIAANSRGVPDVSYNADSRTGVLIYDTEPGLSGLRCPSLGGPCSAGWFVIGGTSAGSPQWAGLIAIAAQMNHGPLGFINPALYRLATGPNYASDFRDITAGNNLNPNPKNINPDGSFIVPGFNASSGWDPVTGLGSPDAANLLPDLIAAVNTK
jgi:subtilase family serine protease